LKTVIRENEDYVWVKKKAGENWHEFVLWTIDQILADGKHVAYQAEM
jgi:UDP-N-acetylmuramate dehydrogenase